MLKRIKQCSQCPSQITARSISGLCGDCNRRARKNHLRPYEWLYNRLLREAAKRKLEVTISYEDFLRLTQIKCCRYCNGPVNWYPVSRKGGAGTNLDRKDNSIGYTLHNVAVCCVDCNTRKSNWVSAEEFQFLQDALRTWRNLDVEGRRSLEYMIYDNGPGGMVFSTD